MMPHARYAAIVLAAGFSSRMEQFKPLLQPGGLTITDRVISMFDHNGIDVFVVVGWKKKELLSGIQSRNVIVVENPDYERGMFTSVLAGLRHLPPDCKSFFIMPVDIPLVRPATVQILLKKAEENPGRIIYSCFGGRRGHPTLIPSKLIQDILLWKQEGGLKAFLNSKKELALEVNVPDRNILFDIDIPEDFREAEERLKKNDVPTKEECEIIIDELYPMPSPVRKHCEKVTEVATAICKKLQQSGRSVDVEMVRAAAMMHDLAKGLPNHEEQACRILHELGFGKVGDLISDHMELKNADDKTSLEEKIVYLADKFVEEDRLISLEERYRTSGRRFIVTNEIKARILERKARALMIKKDLEEIIGRYLEEIIFEPTGNSQ
ncbi:MAG TPA: NTP transferase domain-containing protein [Smithella sp.]|nr:NTP transferase domain-containing protein [Smithella sp.]